VSVKQHENVRVQVAQLLRDLLKDVVDERFRISRDLYSYALLKLLESPEEIVTLMPQEVYVTGERRTVDMALGNKIVFEFKSSEREFEDAERSASEKYWPLVSKADYFIVTNWDKWRIYRVTRKGLEPVEVCDRQRAVELLRTQVIPHVKEIKIPPLPQNVEALTTDNRMITPNNTHSISIKNTHHSYLLNLA